MEEEEINGGPINNPILSVALQQQELANKRARGEAFKIGYSSVIGVQGDNDLPTKLGTKKEFDDQIMAIDWYTNPDKIEDIRADRQSTWSRIKRGTSKVLSTAVTSTGQGIGFLAGSLGYAADGFENVDLVFKNPMVKFFDNIQEDIDQETVSYKPSDYESMSLGERLTQGSFWSDEFASGLGFAVSSFIPQIAIAKAGTAFRGATLAAKLGKANNLYRSAKTAEVLNKGVQGLTSLGAVAFGRLGESGIEANEAYEQAKNKLLNEKSEGLNNYSDEEIEERAKAVRSNVFTGNMLLAVSDLYQFNLLFKPYSTLNKAANNILFKEGVRYVAQKAGTRLSTKRFLAPIATSIVLESQEENFQLALSNTAQKLATSNWYGDEGIKLDELTQGIKDEMINNFHTVEGQTSMFLGALLGGGMGTVANVINNPNTEANKQTESYATALNKQLELGGGEVKDLERNAMKNFIGLQTSINESANKGDAAKHKQNIDFMFANFTKTYLDTNKINILYDELSVMENMNAQEFTDAFGITQEEMVDDNGDYRTVKEIVSEYKNQAKTLERVYNTINPVIDSFITGKESAKYYNSVRDKAFFLLAASEIGNKELNNLNKTLERAKQALVKKAAQFNLESSEVNSKLADEQETVNILEKEVKAKSDQLEVVDAEYKKLISNPNKAAEQLTKEIASVKAKEKAVEAKIKDDSQSIKRNERIQQELEAQIETQQEPALPFDEYNDNPIFDDFEVKELTPNITPEVGPNNEPNIDAYSAQADAAIEAQIAKQIEDDITASIEKDISKLDSKKKQTIEEAAAELAEVVYDKITTANMQTKAVDSLVESQENLDPEAPRGIDTLSLEAKDVPTVEQEILQADKSQEAKIRNAALAAGEYRSAFMGINTAVLSKQGSPSSPNIKYLELTAEQLPNAIDSIIAETNQTHDGRQLVDFEARINPSIVYKGKEVRFVVPRAQDWYATIHKQFQAAKEKPELFYENKIISKIPVVVQTLDNNGEYVNIDQIGIQTEASKQLRTAAAELIVSGNWDVLNEELDLGFRATVENSKNAFPNRIKVGEDILDFGSPLVENAEGKLVLREKLQDYVPKGMTFPFVFGTSNGTILLTKDGLRHPDYEILENIKDSMQDAAKNLSAGQLYTILQTPDGYTRFIPVNRPRLTDTNVDELKNLLIDFKQRTTNQPAVIVQQEFNILKDKINELVYTSKDSALYITQDRIVLTLKSPKTGVIKRKSLYFKDDVSKITEVFDNPVVRNVLKNFPKVINATSLYVNPEYQKQILATKGEVTLNILPSFPFRSNELFYTTPNLETSKETTIEQPFEQVATLEFNDDYDTSDLVFRIQDKTKYVEWSEEQELAWLQTRLPNTPVTVLSDIQLLAKFRKNIFGAVTEKAIFLSKAAEVGTAYHEAFHIVYRYLSTGFEQENIIKEAKIRYNKPNASELELEELMAEEFREYVLSEQSAPKTLIERLFQRLKDFINFALFNRISLDRLYRDINQGKFAQKEINIDSRYSISDRTTFPEVAFRLIPEFTPEEQSRRIDNITQSIIRQYNKLKLQNKQGILPKVNIAFEALYDAAVNKYADVAKKAKEEGAINTEYLAEKVVAAKESLKEFVLRRLGDSGFRSYVISEVDKDALVEEPVLSDSEVTETQDSVEETLNEDDSHNTETFGSRYGFKEDPKKKLTTQIKIYLQSIPKIKNGKIVRDAVGDISFIDEDDLYADMSIWLAGKESLEEMLEELNKHLVVYPGLRHLVDMVSISSDAVKNQFFSAFRRENYNFTSIGNWFNTFTIYESVNERKDKVLIRQWKNFMETAADYGLVELYKYDDKQGVFKRNPDLSGAKKVLLDFQTAISEVTGATTRTAKDKNFYKNPEVQNKISEVLATIGISISPAAIDLAVNSNFKAFYDTHIKKDGQGLHRLLLQFASSTNNVFGVGTREAQDDTYPSEDTADTQTKVDKTYQEKEGSSIDNVAKLAALVANGADKSSRRGADNKLQYTINLPRKIFNILSEYKKNVRAWVTKRQQNILVGNIEDYDTKIDAKETDMSLLHQMMLDPINANKVLEVSSFGEVSQKNLSKASQDYQSMTKAERFKTSFQLWYNNGAKDSYHMQPTPGDKSNTFVFKLPKLTKPIQERYGDYYQMLYRIYRQELKRVSKVNLLKNQVKALLQNKEANIVKLNEIASSLVASYHFPLSVVEGLTSQQEINDAILNAFVADYSEAKTPSAFKINHFENMPMSMYKNDVTGVNNTEVKAYIKQWVADNIEVLKNKLAANELITIDKGVITDNKLGINTNKETTSIDKLLGRYFVESFIMNVEMIHLTAGDIAQYKNKVDFNKRYPQVTTPGNEYRFANPNYQLVILSDIILNSEANTTKWQDSLSSYLESIGMKVPSVIKDGNAYADINATDAQGFMTMNRAKEVLLASGKFTPDIEELYNKLLRSEATTEQAEEFTRLLLVKKPIHYGEVDNNGELIQMYVKYSAVPLIPQALAKGSLIDNLRIKLEVLEEEKGMNAEAVFQSGVKVGAHKIGAIQDLANLQSIVTSNSNYREVVPYSYKDADARFGSQLMKLIINNIRPNATYTINGENISGEQLVKNYDNLIGNQIADSYNQFIEELGFDLSSTANLGAQYENENTKKTVNTRIAKLIQNELARNNSAPEMYELAAQVDSKGNFKFPLSHPVFGQKFESLVISLFTSRIQKQLLPGFSAIDVSELMGTDLVQTSSKLKYIRAENGEIKHAETKVSMDFIAKRFKAIGKQKEFYEIYNNEGPQGILKQLKQAGLDTIVAYRIPTSEKHSMIPLKIVELLPLEVKTQIILPAEATKQAGLDFDLDKSNILFKNFSFNNGRIVPTSSSNTKNSLEVRANEIVEMIEQVLLSPNSLEDMLTPISTKEVSDLRDEIQTRNQELSQTPIPKLEVANPVYNIETAVEGLVGKSLIGIFANHTVSNTRSQVYKHELIIPIEVRDRRFTDLGTGESKVSQTLSALLNAATDNAKDPMLSQININLYTADVVGMLTRLGIPLKDTVEFLNLPDIKRFVELAEQTSEDNALNKLGVNKGQILKGIKTQIKNNQPVILKASPSLVGNITTLLALKKLSGDLFTVDRALRADVSNAGPSILHTSNFIRSINKALDVETIITRNTDGLIFDKMFQQKVYGQPTQLYKELFDWNKPLFTSISDKLQRLLKREVTPDVQYKLFNQFYNFIMSVNTTTNPDVISESIPFLNDFVYNKEYRDNLTSGNATVAKKIVDIKRRINKVIDANPELDLEMPYVFNYLETIIDKANAFDRVTFTNAAKLTVNERILIQESFRRMYQSSYAEFGIEINAELSQIASDLGYYALASNGFYRAPGNLLDIIPAEFWENTGFNRYYLEVFRPKADNNDYVESLDSKLTDFVTQFVQNNWKSLRLRRLYKEDMKTLGIIGKAGDPILVSRVDEAIANDTPSYLLVQDQVSKTEFLYVAVNKIDEVVDDKAALTIEYAKVPKLGLSNFYKEYNYSNQISKSIFAKEDSEVATVKVSAIELPMQERNVYSDILPPIEVQDLAARTSPSTPLRDIYNGMSIDVSPENQRCN